MTNNSMSSAIDYWNYRVRHNHQQSINAQNRSDWSCGDFWEPFASFFKGDPHRTNDLVLNRLLVDLTPETTVLDVGGGAGKFALPLALNCGHTTVVEPSDSMVRWLCRSADEANIRNLSIVQQLWETAVVQPADLVLCAHVLYGAADIEPFISKLVFHARKRVAILAYVNSPMSLVAPFWKLVHGEERIDLPALPELMNVLWEMGIFPDLEMFPETAPEVVEGWEAALKLLRHFLHVRPGTEQDQRLRAAMNELLVETLGGLVVQGAGVRRQGLISWTLPKPRS